MKPLNRSAAFAIAIGLGAALAGEAFAADRVKIVSGLIETTAAPAGRGGPAHSAEIQYAMGNLSLDKRYAWEPADSRAEPEPHRARYLVLDMLSAKP